MTLLSYDFMRNALLASVLVGLTAPTVGIYLVQRRLSLIGDGLGHVSLAGVAIGVLTGRAPVATALAAAVVGAVAVELIRTRGRTSGDVALAVLFYGGIAGGVVIISQAPGGTPASLNAYLFGAITTTSASDLVIFGVLAFAVLAITVGLGRYLFAVSDDEEYAAASGLPVLGLNLTLSIVTAVTVVISMRVVGLLLISALMIIPVASAQLVSRSFRGTLALSAVIGVVVGLSGVVVSFYTDTPSGGMIVVLAIGLFVALTVSYGTWTRLRTRSGRHPADAAELASRPVG